MSGRNELVPGALVRYTGKWLASTGQRTGPAGQRRMMVMACDCAMCADTYAGGFLAIDTPAEIYPDEPAGTFRWQHVAKANLQLVKGAPLRAGDMP